MRCVRADAVVASMMLFLLALAGCMDNGLDESEAGGRGSWMDLPYQGEDCDGKGRLHEHAMYVKEDHTWNPHDDKVVGFFGFSLSPQGPFTTPGPEFRIKQCDTLRVTLHGAEAHTIHWHGQSVPFHMDGVPFMTQPMGEASYVYEFQAFEPGTYWYHCHVEAPAHVDAGLFGALIVEPLEPDPPADVEHVLMLHETDSAMGRALTTLNGDGGFSPSDLQQNPFEGGDHIRRTAYFTAEIADLIQSGVTGENLWTEGPRAYYPASSIRYRPQYDTFMLNGKSYPETEPIVVEEGDTVRLRLINAGQLLHTMHLHGHHFLVTHKDGFPLPAPYWGDSLVIGPGERYDVYFLADNSGIWDLHDHGGGWGYGGHASNDHAFPGGMATVVAYKDVAEIGHHTVAGDLALFV